MGKIHQVIICTPIGFLSMFCQNKKNVKKKKELILLAGCYKVIMHCGPMPGQSFRQLNTLKGKMYITFRLLQTLFIAKVVN